ncbi:MAG: DUF5317 family protein [Actinomycetota bacterium]
MLLALVAVLVGLAIGLLTRGSLAAARQLRPVLWWAPLLAAGLYVLPIIADDLGGEAVLAALSLTTLLVAALANREIAGLGVVALGIGLNLVPLAIDGATTVGPDAAATVELDTTDDLGVARRLEITEDRVGLLGDRIPLPGLGALVSFGDLIIVVALFDVGLRLTRRQVREPLEMAAASAEAAAVAADGDPWFALVRGDISQDTYAEVTTDEDGDPSAPPPDRAPAARPAPVRIVAEDPDEDPVDVPFVETGQIRHDELDLSLVRWADEPEHTGADTDELDLRDLQNLLDEPEAPGATPSRTAVAASAFDATLARFDNDHGIEDPGGGTVTDEVESAVGTVTDEVETNVVTVTDEVESAVVTVTDEVESAVVTVADEVEANVVTVTDEVESADAVDDDRPA